MEYDKSKNEELKIREMLGEWIQQTRREKGFSQSALSELTGITTSYISEIERGKKSVNFIYMVRIMIALQESMDELAEKKMGFRIRKPIPEPENEMKRRIIRLLDQMREEELDLLYYEIWRIRRLEKVFRSKSF